MEGLYQALALYDDEGKGEITVEDLKEGLESIELYDENQERAFDAFVLYFLIKNNNNPRFVNIETIMNEFFPEWVN